MLVRSYNRSALWHVPCKGLGNEHRKEKEGIDSSLTVSFKLQKDLNPSLCQTHIGFENCILRGTLLLAWGGMHHTCIRYPRGTPFGILYYCTWRPIPEARNYACRGMSSVIWEWNKKAVWVQGLWHNILVDMAWYFTTVLYIDSNNKLHHVSFHRIVNIVVWGSCSNRLYVCASTATSETFWKHECLVSLSYESFSFASLGEALLGRLRTLKLMNVRIWSCNVHLSTLKRPHELNR